MSGMGNRRLGRYELGRLLGQGGSGWVYEAVLCGPAGFRKPCAVKVLQDDGDGLVREARLAGLLRHPNLVEVYELGFAEWGDPGGLASEGTWFCSMELVGGGSLDKRLPLPPAAALDVVQQVARGLVHAHEEVGMVHLDLKPANILMDHGVAKLADLGIAQARGFNTLVGIRGTPGYVAPEVLAGHQRPDLRADVFGLGVVLCELITGQRRPDHRTPDWLRTVLRDALAIDPEQRYPTVGAFAARLASLDVSGPGIPEVFAADLPRPSGAQPGQDSTYLTQMGSIPESVSPLVGRNEVLGRIGNAIEQHRLVTLKGMGGIGKSRCAAEAARDWTQQRRGRLAVWCQLEHAKTEEAVLNRLSEALSVPLNGTQTATWSRQIGHVLHSLGHVLLVLDTVEHLGDDLGMVHNWLGQASGLRILSTSRTRLQMESEHVVEIPALSEAEGVELLKQRVQDSGGSSSDVDSLLEMVRRLDGLPLALELTAARLSVLSPRQIIERLDDRFRLLGKRRGSVERHRTLREALEFSWEHLPAYLREAMGQLALFKGSFSLSDAESVLQLSDPDAPWALDIVGDLLDESWIQAQQGLAEPRFSMFETVVVYARGQAPPTDEGVSSWLQWCAGFGTEQRLAELRTSRGLEFWQILRDSGGSLHEGLRVAMEREAWETAAQISLGLVQITARISMPTQLWQQVQTILDAMPPGSERERLVVGYLNCLVLLRRLEDVPAWAAQVESTSVHRPWAQRWVAEAAVKLGDYPGALKAAEQGLLCRPLSVAVRAQLQQQAANALVRMGKLDEAERRYEEALSLNKKLGNTMGVGHVLANLGARARQAGDPRKAYRHYVSSSRSLREVNDWRSELLVSLNLGLLARYQNRMNVAVEAFERAAALSRRVGDSIAALQAELSAAVTRLEHGAPVSQDVIQDLVDRSVDLGVAQLQGLALRGLSQVYQIQGELERADQVLRDAIAMLRQQGLGVDAQHCAAHRSRLWLTVGNEKRALSSFEGLGASTFTVSPPSDGVVLGTLAELAQIRGDDAECQHLAQRARELGLVAGVAKVDVAIRLSQARIERRSGTLKPDVLTALKRTLDECGLGPGAPMYEEWRTLQTDADVS